jgi:hypothetical protein
MSRIADLVVVSDENVHSVQFGGSTAGNLLHAELTQFRLELVELFLEVILVLAP